MTERYYPLAVPQSVTPALRETQAETPEALVSFAALRRFAARRWRLVVGIAALCTLGAACALPFLPRTYLGTVVLMADPRPQKVSPTEAVLGGIGTDTAAVESQVEILESSTLARQVIAELGLDDAGELTEPSLVEKAVDYGRDLLGIPAAVEPGERQERILSRFAERRTVRRRGLTYVLEINYASRSPQTAAAVSNALAAAYLSDQRSLKLEAAKGAAGMLDARLDELRRRAREAERAVSTFKNQNDIVDIGGGLTLLDREIAEQSQQLAQVRARSVEAEARLAQAQRAAQSPDGGATLAESLQSAVVANLRTQHAQIGAQLADLRNNLGPRHPAVTSAEAQLRNVTAQTQTEIERLIKALRNESQSAASRERALSASLDHLKRQAGQSGQARVRLAELEREAQASKLVLEQYLVRQKDASEQQNLQSADARVLSPAAAPIRPNSPKPVLILSLALIGGLGLGLGAAAVVDAREPGLRTAGGVERTLRVPVIGLLPRLPPGRLGLGQTRLLGDSRQDLRFGDAVRVLALPFAARIGGRPGSTLFVSSAETGEGKSTVAEHLAETFARQGHSVLLVDIDARNPRLTRARADLGSPGLLDALGRSFDPDSVIRRGTVDAVSFLPIGVARDNVEAAELFFSPALGRAIAELRQRFDLIVLDGPPLLEGVEGRLLLAHADQTALVVEWGRTSREQVMAAAQLLRDAPGVFGGIVLNKVDMKALPRYA